MVDKRKYLFSEKLNKNVRKAVKAIVKQWRTCLEESKTQLISRMKNGWNVTYDKYTRHNSCPQDMLKYIYLNMLQGVVCFVQKKRSNDYIDIVVNTITLDVGRVVLDNATYCRYDYQDECFIDVDGNKVKCNHNNVRIVFDME